MTSCFKQAYHVVLFLVSHQPTISSLKFTDSSFRYLSPRLWNQLPDSFRQPHQSCLDSPPHPLVNSSLSSSPLSSSITPHLSLQFRNLPFQHILPTLNILLLPIIGLPSRWVWTRLITVISLFLVSHFIFLFIPCGRLSWLVATCQLFTAR